MPVNASSSDSITITVSLYPVFDGEGIRPSGSNTTYEINVTLTFDTFDVENGALYFNGHIFQIEPDTGFAMVKINNWNPPIMEFEVTATDEIVVVLGGFTFGDRYGIYVDEIHWQNRYITTSGTLSFEYPHFSSHTFSIGNYTMPPSADEYRPFEGEEYGVTAPPYEEVDWTFILLSAGVIFFIPMSIIFFYRKNKNFFN